MKVTAIEADRQNLASKEDDVKINNLAKSWLRSHPVDVDGLRDHRVVASKHII
jgi:hypothetical protein